RRGRAGDPGGGVAGGGDRARDRGDRRPAAAGRPAGLRRRGDVGPAGGAGRDRGAAGGQRAAGARGRRDCRPPRPAGAGGGGGPDALTRAVEGAEDHPEFAERDLEALGLSAADVLVGIATSGRTPYVLGAVGYARRQGTFTVGLSCNPDAEVIGHVDLAITPV